MSQAETDKRVRFDAKQASAWLPGSQDAGDASQRFSGVSIDTRSIAPGDLFFAIRGPNHDAHAFLDRAVDAGAAGLVVEQGCAETASLPQELSVFSVADTTRALGDLAHGHRASFQGPVLGLTGSSGKTTTKEMVAAVFATKAPCLATRGNLNNDYGVPLTLMRREEQHQLAVIEMGMNHRGEIARLAEIAAPTHALVTNIGTAHIEYLGSIEEIANEKGDVFAALPANGVALANLDDARVAEQAKRAPCPILGYGTLGKAAIRAGQVRFDAGCFQIEILTPEASAEVPVRGLAETTVINALAAAAAGIAAGCSFEQLCEGLAGYEPIRGRMTPIPLASGVTVVDDTYNANPDSLRSSLEGVRSLAATTRAIAVIGDMGELGDAADAAHREAGATAARLGFDAVFALGERASLVCEGARSAGIQAASVATSHEEIAERVAALAKTGDWVLVKGSRAMQMERVVAALEGQEKG